jgi:hypothetical protein
MQSDLIRIVIERNLNFDIHIDKIVIMILIILILCAMIFRRSLLPSLRRMEINEAEFGIGDQKITLRPNTTDLQIAYKIWIELCTRKIGLPIDLNHDVISEVYDSWYSFFSVTRDLIKELPVTRFKRKDTAHIIRISIEVLNNGVRPHLTKWQARFRRWYEQALTNQDYLLIDPQDIQKKFPRYDELVKDLLVVNGRLIQYKQKLNELLTGMPNPR